MGLTEENRKDIVVYRNIHPTEEFIVKVSGLAKEKLGINPEI